MDILTTCWFITVQYSTVYMCFVDDREKWSNRGRMARQTTGWFSTSDFWIRNLRLLLTR